LQGVWNNSTITPLERPAALEEKEFLSEKEATALETAANSQWDQRSSDPKSDLNGAYNGFWMEGGGVVRSRRTSLIVEPANGRIPPLTPEGQQRAAAAAAAMRGIPSGPEDRSLAERCLTRGAPKLPGAYNNNVQIFQTKEYVAIVQEMIHEVRIIPLDQRPHVSPRIRQWLGDSRGHWEGDTLVVDTTNYHHMVGFASYYCCPGAGPSLHITERYKRIDKDRIDYEFTVDDPTTYTKTFVIAVPMTRIEGPIFEYACHEGNYGMSGLLSGARSEERAAAQK
jgi:hypothetical protein